MNGPISFDFEVDFAGNGLQPEARQLVLAISYVQAQSLGLRSVSGAASMYVTRRCIERIGLPDESYFLFFEDLDWGVRSKSVGLGYASASIVAHKRGTTTGSAQKLASLSRLSAYLQHRSAIHFIRKFFPWTLPIRVFVSLLYALRFLLSWAPHIAMATLEGMFAGLKGETCRPARHLDSVSALEETITKRESVSRPVPPAEKV
jgi:GT2 family glycosyltransferase